ncbi:MAG: HNH endonuclease signature motif containing protein, partial [Actinomycetota bacterium]|nr:HNH endonuclease signature motif containing protein [Actinomycetota bacterium]
YLQNIRCRIFVRYTTSISGGIENTPDPPHGAGVHPDLIDLDKAISGVFDTPLSAMTVGEVIEQAAEVQRLRNRLDAILGQHLTAANNTAALTPPYVEIPATDIAAGSHTNPRPLRDAVLLHRWLEAFPVFNDAHRSGALSAEHLQALKTVDRDAVHHHLIDSQDLLVDIAASLDWVDFGRALTHWVNAADPDGLQPRNDQQNRPTGLSHKTNTDGTIDGRFHLNPLAAQAFTTAIGTETEKLFKQPTDQNQPVRRTAYQLGGQALLNLITRGHQHPNGSPLIPLIDLVIGHQLAQNILERMHDPTIEPVPPSTTDPDRWCHYIDGTPVHPVHAAGLLAIGRIQTSILDGQRNIRSIQTKARRFPPWMRHTLALQSKGRCAINGCDAPYPWLQADHIKPATRGGPTTLDNGQTLCQPHNHLKTDHEPDDG